jgi:hypothetical protein
VACVPRDYARAMPRTARLIASALAVAAMFTACSEEPEVIDVGTRVTSAADALECPEGAEAETRSVEARSRLVQEDARAALHAWAERARRSSDLPLDGYQVAVEEVGTVLFTHENEDRVEIAVIAERTEDSGGDLGWLVQSWARCRPAGSGS